MLPYSGKILCVNLTSQEIHTEAVPDWVYEHFLGGVGLGAYLLYQRIPAGADALGPENVLGFVSGLLTGTGSLMTGRWMVVCKSPLTGGWGDANCGGTFSPAIKQCGYDGIFVSGCAAEPVYLYVDDEKAELRPAAHLWGRDAVESEELLQAAHAGRTKPSVAVIGTAGEKLSLISGICNDGGRIAARSGVGAVMGSKRLKAVVLCGSRPIGAYDPAAVKAISSDLAGRIRRQSLPRFVPAGVLSLAGHFMTRMSRAAPLDGLAGAAFLKRWGTSLNNAMGITSGDTPVKNWGGSVKDFPFSKYNKLNPDRILRREVRKYSCYSCTLGCGGICDLRDLGQGQFTHSHKPEYETCAVFGPLTLNTDLDAIFLLNELLNRAGMDIISAGGTVAFAIECFENGILTREMTGGLELCWGNSAAVVELVRRMIAREGIGDLLADGVRAAAARLGKGAQAFAVHAGGQEPGMHDSRLDPLIGVHFSADPTPGRHTIGSGQGYDVLHLWEQVSWAPNPGSYLKADEYVPSEKVAWKTVAGACFKQVLDGSGGCQLATTLGLNHWKLFDWLNAATGWGKTPDEYMQIGKRIQTLRQMFNTRQGVAPRSFQMHSRMAGQPPLEEGPLKGRTVPIAEMMRLYWRCFGWDEDSGAPLEKTMVELGLLRYFQPSG